MSQLSLNHCCPSIDLTRKQLRPWSEGTTAIVNAFQDERLIAQLKIRLWQANTRQNLHSGANFVWQELGLRFSARDSRLENYGAHRISLMNHTTVADNRKKAAKYLFHISVKWILKCTNTSFKQLRFSAPFSPLLQELKHAQWLVKDCMTSQESILR